MLFLFFPLHLNFVQVWDLNVMMNGILSGLVSITSGCAFVEEWAAFLIGVISGAIYIGVSKVLQRLKIDDPLDATGTELRKFLLFLE